MEGHASRFSASGFPREYFNHMTSYLVDADKMCLVLGVVAQPTLATQQGNTFGTAFRSAADDTEAQTQHDGFDSSIMRVSHRQQMQMQLISLHCVCVCMHCLL